VNQAMPYHAGGGLRRGRIGLHDFLGTFLRTSHDNIQTLKRLVTVNLDDHAPFNEHYDDLGVTDTR